MRTAAAFAQRRRSLSGPCPPDGPAGPAEASDRRPDASAVRGARAHVGQEDDLAERMVGPEPSTARRAPRGSPLLGLMSQDTSPAFLYATRAGMA